MANGLSNIPGTTEYCADPHGTDAAAIRQVEGIVADYPPGTRHLEIQNTYGAQTATHGVHS
jgi:hypothetical protein